VVLTGREMKFQRMAAGIAEQMDFRAETPTRTA
jgi:hypothetical protein